MKSSLKFYSEREFQPFKFKIAYVRLFSEPFHNLLNFSRSQHFPFLKDKIYHISDSHLTYVAIGKFWQFSIGCNNLIGRKLATKLIDHVNKKDVSRPLNLSMRGKIRTCQSLRAPILGLDSKNPCRTDYHMIYLTGLHVFSVFFPAYRPVKA